MDVRWYLAATYRPIAFSNRRAPIADRKLRLRGRLQCRLMAA